MLKSLKKRMKVSIAVKKGQDPLVLDLPGGATVKDLKAAFYTSKKGYHPSRQSFK